MNIGKRIKKEREEKNISKIKLAEEAGCTVRAIDYWEAGKRSISFENANKIFKALNITVSIGAQSEIN